MKLYNTLSRSLETFEPLAPPNVGIYVCGPTVYDDPHIGHARSAYVFDVLRRYLAHRGYKVTFVRNVTDVDDKIIEKARQETGDRRQETGNLAERCREVAERYLKSYHETMDRLGIARPDIEPKATEHIDAMLDLISKLVLDGTAYEAQGPATEASAGRDVYFSVRKFAAYGRLSNRALDELKAGARVEPGEHPGPTSGAGKQDPLDFALWKAAKPDEPSWNSPWGPGRPGWHIECSVMSTAYLGDAFDIHGGGVDLVFPHHENEIAQTQALGKPFAKHWIHNGLLTVNGEKMSKSLGNFITVEKALQSVFEKPDALKVFFLGTHYRSPIDYTEENTLAANRRLSGWVHFLDRAASYRKGRVVVEPRPDRIKQLEEEFTLAMDDDLNTPQALAVLDKLVAWGHECEKQTLLSMHRPGDIQEIRFRNSSEIPRLHGSMILAADVVKQLADVLGLLSTYAVEEIPPEVKKLVDERELARRQKRFKEADVLRKEIEQLGFVVSDTAGQPVVRPKR